MDQNRTDSTQHPDRAEVPSNSSEEQTTNSTATPFIHPFMMAQFNPLYHWPYLHPMMNPFAQFPIGQVPYALCPFPVAPWYYFQQHMMGTPVYIQPVPFIIPPSVTSQSPIAQSTNTGPGTSITTNFVTFNDIGNDNSTNVRIHKNGRNTGSG